MERALISICILCVLIVKGMGWRFNCLAVTFYCSQCWACTLEIYTVRAHTHACTCASTAQGSNVLLAIKVKTPYKSLLWALVNYYSASFYTPLHSIHFFLRLLSHLHHILCTGSPDSAQYLHFVRVWASRIVGDAQREWENLEWTKFRGGS